MTSRTISLIVATTAGVILLCTTAPVLLVGGIAAACITPTHPHPTAGQRHEHQP